MNLTERLDSFREEGYYIKIETIKGPFDPNDEEDRPYYIYLFLGDTNRLHLPATLNGIGYGWSIEEALNNAIVDLSHPVTKKKAGEE